MKSFIFILTFLSLFCKGRQKDSLVFKRDSIILHHPLHTENKSLDLRVGFGTYTSDFVELGLTRNFFSAGCAGMGGYGYYGSVEWIPSKWSHYQKSIYGIKTGAELALAFLALGAELKYQTDFTKNDFVFSPKVGFTFGNKLSVFYVYQLSFFRKPFSEVLSSHQVNLVLNIPIKKIKEKRK